jgi:beta-lactamase regulating signal transducer with metallopeptidase domain
MDGFITELVDRLIATTLHTVVFGLVVWAISYRSFRLPPHVQCWLWWLVSLQALIGLAAGPIELPWLPAAATSDSLAVSSINEIVDTSSNTAGIEAWRLIAFSVWSLFVLVTAWITFREWLQGRTILQRAVPHEGVKALSQLVMLAQRKGLRRLPRMLVSSECTSPLLAGNFRPVLLMPARCTLSDVDLEMAISHELAHLRRNDLAWG